MAPEHELHLEMPAELTPPATGLLRFAVGHLRAAGAGAVRIAADPEDIVKHLYARFGFRPTAVSPSRVRPR